MPLLANCRISVLTILPWHIRQKRIGITPLQWRHNRRDGVWNHQPHHCLLNRLFRRRSKKTSKLRVTGLSEENSPVTGELPTKRSVTRKMLPFDDVIMTLTTGCKPIRAAGEINHWAVYTRQPCTYINVWGKGMVMCPNAQAIDRLNAGTDISRIMNNEQRYIPQNPLMHCVHH